MRRKLRNLLYVLVVAVTITACGAMQKTIKTGNPQLIYDMGLEFYENEQWSKASTMFSTIDHLYVATSREDTISYYLARCRAKSGDYYTAIDILDEFRDQFGRSVFIEDAEAMRTMCYYYLAPGPTRDQTPTTMAISSAYEFISRYPESDKVDGFFDVITELKGRLYDKSFINAYTYYKIGRYKSAMVAFRNAMKEFPETTRREDLSYYVVASGYELAKNSIPSKQLDRYISMLDSYYTFIAEFPDSEYTKDVNKMAKEAKSYIDKHQIPETDEE